MGAIQRSMARASFRPRLRGCGPYPDWREFTVMKPLPRLEYSGAVDGDGHVLEPPDLWQNYLDPIFRSRAPTVRADASGLEFLEIDGEVSKLVRNGMPAGLGAMDRVAGHVYERDVVTGLKYVDQAPLGAMDPKERIERLDMENIERVFLYPTLTLFWVAECEDEDYTQACLRAYNRWIVDFCADSAGRLLPMAQLSLGDPEAAERELRRAAEDGVAGFFVPPFQWTRKPLGDSAHDRVFAAAQESGLPLGIHPSLEPKWTAPGRFGNYTSGKYGFFLNVTAADAVRHAFTSLFQYGVFEKFPALRILLLESGAGWVGYWLDRMDTVYASPQGFRVRELLPEKPSFYFRRQCWISGDPDETSLANIIALVGADRFFWASDFPHPDHPPDYIPELERLTRALPEFAREGFLGANVLRAFGI
ncbi:MAG TPA: amidohydrolase [Myxococcales bacterium]|nr:amidohydrolase [Myxococcales bacterium]